MSASAKSLELIPTLPDDFKPADIKGAMGLRYYRCRCPCDNTFLVFFDEADKPYALIKLNPENLVNFVLEISEYTDMLLDKIKEQQTGGNRQNAPTTDTTQ